MPSTSPKQHRFMEAIAHSPSFAKQAGVPQSVGKDFARADDKAGITKTHGGQPAHKEPSGRDRHMARLKGEGHTTEAVGKLFGRSKTTAHRGVAAGYRNLGSARD